MQDVGDIDDAPVRGRRTGVVFEQFASFVARTASGLILLMVALFFVERYRKDASYANAYEARRLDELTRLWQATESHGLKVLGVAAQAEGGTGKPDELRARLEGLGEEYYRQLGSAGLFLGPDRVNRMRGEIGDQFLADLASRLSDGRELAAKLRDFRANWKSVLQEPTSCTGYPDEIFVTCGDINYWACLTRTIDCGTWQLGNCPSSIHTTADPNCPGGLSYQCVWGSCHPYGIDHPCGSYEVCR